MQHSPFALGAKKKQDLTLPSSSSKKGDSSGPLLSGGMAGIINIRNQERIEVKLFGLVFGTFHDLGLTCLWVSSPSVPAHAHAEQERGRVEIAKGGAAQWCQLLLERLSGIPSSPFPAHICLNLIG